MTDHVCQGACQRHAANGSLPAGQDVELYACLLHRGLAEVSGLNDKGELIYSLTEEGLSAMRNRTWFV